jgi:hypothetical protein
MRPLACAMAKKMLLDFGFWSWAFGLWALNASNL